ncbi:putative adhesin [Pandoraea commovens]|uniref:putative adhesin n=1 Tax=Pandoraea commovens TaxID=2508289 RepID=UPI0012413BF8|nr:hypothetical protein [Pandoraea commovens]
MKKHNRTLPPVLTEVGRKAFAQLDELAANGQPTTARSSQASFKGALEDVAALNATMLATETFHAPPAQPAPHISKPKAAILTAWSQASSAFEDGGISSLARHQRVVSRNSGAVIRKQREVLHRGLTRDQPSGAAKNVSHQPKSAMLTESRSTSIAERIEGSNTVGGTVSWTVNFFSHFWTVKHDTDLITKFRKEHGRPPTDSEIKKKSSKFVNIIRKAEDVWGNVVRLVNPVPAAVKAMDDMGTVLDKHEKGQTVSPQDAEALNNLVIYMRLPNENAVVPSGKHSDKMVPEPGEEKNQIGKSVARSGGREHDEPPDISGDANEGGNAPISNESESAVLSRRCRAPACALTPISVEVSRGITPEMLINDIDVGQLTRQGKGYYQDAQGSMYLHVGDLKFVRLKSLGDPEHNRFHIVGTDGETKTLLKYDDNAFREESAEERLHYIRQALDSEERSHALSAEDIIAGTPGQSDGSAKNLLSHYEFPKGGVFSDIVFAEHFAKNNEVPSWATDYHIRAPRESTAPIRIIEDVKRIPFAEGDISPTPAGELKLGKVVDAGQSGTVFLDASDSRFVFKEISSENFSLDNLDDRSTYKEIAKNEAKSFEKYYGTGSAVLLQGKDGRLYIRQRRIPGTSLSEVPKGTLPGDANERFIAMVSVLHDRGIENTNLKAGDVYWDDASGKFYPVHINDISAKYAEWSSQWEERGDLDAKRRMDEHDMLYQRNIEDMYAAIQEKNTSHEDLSGIPKRGDFVDENGEFNKRGYISRMKEFYKDDTNHIGTDRAVRNGDLWERLQEKYPEITGNIDFDSNIQDLPGFTLTTIDGDRGDTLVLSAHGWFTEESTDIQIPKDKEIAFLAPHGRALVDPVAISRGLIPGQISQGSKEIPYMYAKLPGGDRIDAAGNGHSILDQAGSETEGIVKNYYLKNYEKESAAEKAYGVAQNRILRNPHKMDVLTPNLGEKKTLWHVFEAIKNDKKLQGYRVLVFQACREEIISEEPGRFSRIRPVNDGYYIGQNKNFPRKFDKDKRSAPWGQNFDGYIVREEVTVYLNEKKEVGSVTCEIKGVIPFVLVEAGAVVA